MRSVPTCIEYPDPGFMVHSSNLGGADGCTTICSSFGNHRTLPLSTPIVVSVTIGVSEGAEWVAIMPIIHHECGLSLRGDAN